MRGSASPLMRLVAGALALAAGVAMAEEAPAGASSAADEAGAASPTPAEGAPPAAAPPAGDGGSSSTPAPGAAAAPPAPAPAAAALAPTPEPLPEGDTPIWDKLPKPRGYIRSELRYHDPHLGEVYSPRAEAWIPVGSPYLTFGLLPWATHDGYVEGNAEVKFSPSYTFTAYADLSVVYGTLGPATSIFEDYARRIGGETAASVDETLSRLPQTRLIKRAEERLLINELYLNGYVGDHLVLLGGKRRTYWGPSFTWTPSDFVNPSRNPLEPSLEREGRWSGLVDLSFDRFTVSALYAPFELDTPHGLPANWDFSRGTWVGRLYTNPFYQDVNLIYSFNDDVYPNIARHRAGFSYSGYPVGSVEIHAEGAVQLGRTTYLVERRAPETALADLEAPYRVGQFDKDDGRLYGDFLIGSRYAFVDNSNLLVEYLYRSGGYNAAEYARYREYVSYMQRALPELEAALDALSGSGGQVPEGDLEGVAQSWSDLISESPFLFQDAFLRRHYLAAAYQMAIINDRWTPGINAVLGLEDGTLILYPQVQFRMNDAVMLQGGGMVALSPEGAQAEVFPDRFSLNLRMTARF